MGTSSRWVVAAVALGVACRASSNPGLRAGERSPVAGSSAAVAPSATAVTVRTPERALDECHQALTEAQKAPATKARITALQQGCTSLVADAECRNALREQLGGRGLWNEWLVATTCAKRYCPVLGPELDVICKDDECRSRGRAAIERACSAPLPDIGNSFVEAYAALRAAMLSHDFADGDLAGAYQTFMDIAQYMAKSPPHFSATVAPNDAAGVRVELLADDGFKVVAPGAPTVTGKGLDEMASKVPHAPDEAGQSITLVATPGVDFQRVIATMDALRELGYENIQFGTPR